MPRLKPYKTSNKSSLFVTTSPLWEFIEKENKDFRDANKTHVRLSKLRKFNQSGKGALIILSQLSENKEATNRDDLFDRVYFLIREVIYNGEAREVSELKNIIVKIFCSRTSCLITAISSPSSVLMQSEVYLKYVSCLKSETLLAFNICELMSLVIKRLNKVSEPKITEALLTLGETFGFLGIKLADTHSVESIRAIKQEEYIVREREQKPNIRADVIINFFDHYTQGQVKYYYDEIAKILTQSEVVPPVLKQIILEYLKMLKIDEENIQQELQEMSTIPRLI